MGKSKKEKRKGRERKERRDKRQKKKKSRGMENKKLLEQFGTVSANCHLSHFTEETPEILRFEVTLTRLQPGDTSVGTSGFSWPGTIFLSSGHASNRKVKEFFLITENLGSACK